MGLEPIDPRTIDWDRELKARSPAPASAPPTTHPRLQVLLPLGYVGAAVILVVVLLESQPSTGIKGKFYGLTQEESDGWIRDFKKSSSERQAVQTKVDSLKSSGAVVISGEGTSLVTLRRLTPDGWLYITVTPWETTTQMRAR